MGFEARVLTDEPSTTIAAQNGGGAGSAGPFVETRAGIRGAAGGSTRPMIETRVFGGGTNPHGPAAEHERTLRDLTDEPCTTIAAQTGGGAGNAGPFVVTTSQTSQVGPVKSRRREPVEGSVDAPAPAVRAQQGTGLCLTRAASEPERLDRPAPCVTAVEGKGSNDSYRGPDERPKLNKASDAMWLATGRRRLTVEECATLCAFPDGYPFQGTKTARYRQVGNCVVPPCAEAIGRAVLAADTEGTCARSA